MNAEAKSRPSFATPPRKSWPLAVLLLVAIPWVAASAEEPPPKPQLMEGSWTYRSPSTVIGSHSTITVIFQRRTNEWTILRTTNHLKVTPGAGPDRHQVTTLRDGPHRIAIENNKLVIFKSPQPVVQTFLCNSNLLIMPAIVQNKPGEWEFQSEWDSFRVQCEADPFKVPVGRTGISGVHGGKGYYSYEEAPRTWRLWPRAQHIRFLERSDEKGQLVERFRLVFDDYGSPRYEAITATGERGNRAYELGIYQADKH